MLHWWGVRVVLFVPLSRCLGVSPLSHQHVQPQSSGGRRAMIQMPDEGKMDDVGGQGNLGGLYSLQCEAYAWSTECYSCGEIAPVDNSHPTTRQQERDIQTPFSRYCSSPSHSPSHHNLSSTPPPIDQFHFNNDLNSSLSLARGSCWCEVDDNETLRLRSG